MAVLEIVSFVSSLKTAIDITKGIHALKVDTERNESISKVLQILISVQTDALSVQSQYQSLMQEKDVLVKKLTEMDDWKIVQKKYSLAEISEGSFVYSPNENTKKSIPKHFLCANCFDTKKQKSILQLDDKHYNGIRVYVCSNCDAKIKDRSEYKSQKLASHTTRSRGGGYNPFNW